MQTETTPRAPKITLVLDEVRADIARGAAYLDELSPGWRAELDTGYLDMNDCGRCVLGQLPAGSGVFERRPLSWLCDHGFWLSGGTRADYDVLTREWVSYLQSERGATID